MALMKTLLYLASGFYFVTVVILLYYLPSLRSIRKADDEPIIHSHIIAERTAEAICSNLSRKLDSQQQLQMTTLTHDQVYLLSAYYDKRLPEAHYIRILALVASNYKAEVNLHCHITVNQDRMFTMPATLYEFNENHNMPFGGYVFSCPLPNNLAAKLPVCTVKVTDGASSKNSKGVDLVLKEIDPKKTPLYDFSVCIPPIYGQQSAQRLIEFFETTRLLGAQQFFVYTLNGHFLNRQTLDVLEYYQSRHLLTRWDWHLPVSPDKIWYNGQTLLIHHCLFSNMMLARYTAFQDLDELIVPRQHNSWTELMASIDKGTQCGFRFYSVFFSAHKKTTASDQHSLVSLSQQKRTQEVSRFRTKCIVRPSLIFEMGIHHISKQNIEEKTPENVNELIALVHHYRQCDTFFSMNCNAKINDPTMNKYRGPLLQRYQRAKRQILRMFNWTSLS